MTVPQNDYAPGSRSNGYAGAQDPDLSQKAGPVMSSLPHLAARVRHPRRSRFAAFMAGLRQEAALAGPPPRHPESVTAELPEAHEEWLAALAADFWPRDEYASIRSPGRARGGRS